MCRPEVREKSILRSDVSRSESRDETANRVIPRVSERSRLNEHRVMPNRRASSPSQVRDTSHRATRTPPKRAQSPRPRDMPSIKPPHTASPISKRFPPKRVAPHIPGSLSNHRPCTATLVKPQVRRFPSPEIRGILPSEKETSVPTQPLRPVSGSRLGKIDPSFSSNPLTRHVRE